MDINQMDHPFYPKSSIQEADAVAWVLINKDSDLVKYPFKFFPIEQTQVRLKVIYTSICQSDILHGRQQWGPTNYPCCPGHEIVGEITIVGSQVPNLKVGDKVGISPVRFSDMTCKYCLNKNRDTNMCENRIYLYGQYFGGYCTHIQIDHNWAIKLPEGLNLKEVAPLLCAGITVYAPIKRYQRIGGKCAVLGIGGLGHLALQFANKLGMEVTAFTTKLNNLESLKQLGVTNAEHSTNIEQLKKNQGKYDIVVSTLFIDNPQLYRLHQRLAKPGGVYIMLGLPNVNATYQLDNDYLLNNQITICGSNVGSIRQVQEMLQFAAHYDIQSINQHYEYEDFPKAFIRAQKQNPHYRCVINVTNWAKANGFDK